MKKQKYWDNFQLIPMLPSEKSGLHIHYSLYESFFGKTVIATTHRGVCYIGCVSEEQIVDELSKRYPQAVLHRQKDEWQALASLILQGERNVAITLPFHIYGTPFQLAVWSELLQIPEGSLTSYARIARNIGRPKAHRAVGTAVGNNPVMYLIPCHRVVRSNGAIGGYYWGVAMKKKILEVEQHLAFKS